MAKQTFTTGSVLTATQMNNLQANDYNWTVDTKTASYVLVAADAGKRVEMNAAGATTITVNTGLFSAGDIVYLSNIGAGTCTVTAGTATVNKATNASLALGQYQSGQLYFLSASSAIFFPFDVGTAGSSKVVQVITATSTTSTTVASTTYADTTLSATITPTSASNKILVFITQQVNIYDGSNLGYQGAKNRLLRGATVILTYDKIPLQEVYVLNNPKQVQSDQVINYHYVDSPATTSATTYKTQGAVYERTGAATSQVTWQAGSTTSSITLMEIVP